MSPTHPSQQSPTVQRISITLIRHKPERQYFGHDALHTLADRMAAFGLIEPIVVRRDGEVYEIVSGKRRWLAAQRLGWRTIDAKVLDE